MEISVKGKVRFKHFSFYLDGVGEKTTSSLALHKTYKDLHFVKPLFWTLKIPTENQNLNLLQTILIRKYIM